MKWVVSGSWKVDGKSGNVTVDANDLRQALTAAREMGFDGVEAVNVGETAKKKSQFTGAEVASIGKTGPSEAKQTMIRVRTGLLVGGVVLIALEIALSVAAQSGGSTVLGYLGALMICAWAVVLFAGMFLK